MTAGPDIVGEAIAWHLRRDTMDGADWHDFILWLETSPLYASTYDAIALQDGVRDHETTTAPVSAPANDNPKRRWWAVGGGVAAAIAATVIGFTTMPVDSRYTIDTPPGEQRTVTLSDGTVIDVNGATRLTLDRRNTRIALLDSGEAVFHVRHDAGDPFTLTSGTRTVQDAGTVFNVTRDGPRLDVQVAEGAVVFEPGKQALTLNAGGAIVVSEDLNTVAVARVAIDSVGGWRRGTLSYAGVPLSVVGNALQRRYGIGMTLAGGLSVRSFTGMVRLTGDATRDVPHFAGLIGADWQKNGTRWTLSPKVAVAR
ncbi:N/A [soil metagenome]